MLFQISSVAQTYTENHELVRSQTQTIKRFDPLKMKQTASSHSWKDPCNIKSSILSKMHHFYHSTDVSPWPVLITSGSSMWKSVLVIPRYTNIYSAFGSSFFLHLNSAEMTRKSVKIHQHQAIDLQLAHHLSAHIFQSSSVLWGPLVCIR